MSRRWCWALILSATLAGEVWGETLVVTRAGYYLLSQDAAGVPTLKKIDQVVKLDEPTPGPTPNPYPIPTTLTVHRATVQTATAAVVDPNKANTKKALAELYRAVAGLPVANRDQLAEATDKVFAALGLPAAWGTWKVAVDRSLAGFVSLADAKAAWIAVAEVLAQ